MRQTILKYISVTLFSVVLFSSCQKNWLERTPPNILTDDQIWNDERSLTGLLANYYDRLPAHYSLTAGWQGMAEYDEAMWSGFSNDEWRNNLVDYGFNRWEYWDYGLIRDINLSLEKMEELSTELQQDVKDRYFAEFRFLRAMIYFDLVKRMGGVPLVTSQLIYDFSGDVSSLQIPRSREEEVYDFISSELDEIKDALSGNNGNNTRANYYTAMALKSRAMLYAGSLAKYNNLMSAPITTPGGEVGIPAARADDYFMQSLEASRDIINNGGYELYNAGPTPGENFYSALTNKTNNPEVILAQDFLSSGNKRHFFTYDNVARSVREDNLGSSAIAPSLNLVEDFEYLDGSDGTLRTRTANNSDYIYYDDIDGIFANKDGRLYGTIIYPGTTFRGLEVDIQAGVAVWDGSEYDFVESDQLGTTYTDGGTLKGAGGPHRTQQEVTNTGFYLRKYVDDAPQASTRGIQSEMWWVRFRLGEIYLNAAEAALELNLEGEAVGYVNVVRERAGFGPNSLTSLAMDRLRNERRVELAFEDHRVWDLKRWRTAHQVWSGNSSNENAVVYALYPYRVIRPGDAARHNKYIFVKEVAPRFRAPRFFRMGNYYSTIPAGVLNANPKIVRNPFH